MTFVCGLHRAFVFERGGVVPVGELTPITSVRWQRVRDDVSAATVVVPTTECCELLGDLRTILHELHIERNGEVVWQGPITRLEYEFEQVQVFAHDVLWQTTRSVIEIAYDQSYPNIGNVIDRMHSLLYNAYDRDGDPWRMLSDGHLHPIHHADHDDDPRTTRVMNAYQMYAWEDLDKYAEDYGADYTVVNRDIYFSDIQLAWKIIPDLDESHLSQFPRIVEYGNQLATRGIVTNGHGYAGIDTDAAAAGVYGIIDWLTTNENDGAETNIPTTEELDSWTDTAARSISGRAPSPVAIVIPANTTLLPGAPWTVDDLVPGAWFVVTTSRMCRTVSEYQRLHEIVVVEQAPGGEQVQFTAVSAPAHMVVPA